jgi:hypothetical protein
MPPCRGARADASGSNSVASPSGGSTRSPRRRHGSPRCGPVARRVRSDRPDAPPYPACDVRRTMDRSRGACTRTRPGDRGRTRRSGVEGSRVRELHSEGTREAPARRSEAPGAHRHGRGPGKSPARTGPRGRARSTRGGVARRRRPRAGRRRARPKQRERKGPPRGVVANSVPMPRRNENAHRGCGRENRGRAFTARGSTIAHVFSRAGPERSA